VTGCYFHDKGVFLVIGVSFSHAQSRVSIDLVQSCSFKGLTRKIVTLNVEKKSRLYLDIIMFFMYDLWLPPLNKWVPLRLCEYNKPLIALI